MTAEPSANSFRSAVLSGRAGRHDDLVVRAKRSKADPSAEGLTKVAVPRSEARRGNQRDGDRHRLIAEQASLRVGRRNHAIELINLSAGGAMVSGKLDLQLWDQVCLVLGEDGGLECAVRWIKGDRVGLEFAHETQIDCDGETRDALLRDVIRKSFPDIRFAEPQQEPAAEEQTEAEQRRLNTRHPLIWGGTVYHDYEAERVRLRNISATGALIQCEASLPEGATVFLELGAAGRHEATVRWTRGNQSGLKFEQPFDVHSLAESRPEIAAEGASTRTSFGAQEAWAPGWRRSTLDELARDLGG